MASDPGYHFHAPGLPSRRGVIDVGLKCPLNRSPCFDRFLDDLPAFEGIRRAARHTKKHLFTLVDSLVENGLISADITGAEPTLHPDIVPVIRYATSKGLATRIITLGQFLMHPVKGTGQAMLIDALLEAGLTDFRFLVPECEEMRFKAMTGGSWAELETAMFHLDAQGFQYATTSIVTATNYKHTPEIARILGKHNVYRSTILFAICSHQSATPLVQARYSDAAPYVREAVAILQDAGISANVRNAPICTMPGLEKNLSLMRAWHDPDEWIKQVNHLAKPESITPDLSSETGRRFPSQPPHGRIFPAQCAKCSGINVCDGIEPDYLGVYGSDEFVPYFDDKQAQLLVRDRLTNYACFFQKHAAKADIKSAIRRVMKPEVLRKDPVPVGFSQFGHAYRLYKRFSSAFGRAINLAAPVSDPKISVIVTCYNYGEYLGECLDSVYAQTYRNVELIVVDDASTDGSAEIAIKWKKNKPRINVVVVSRSTNAGQPAPCRNQGICLSSGDVICCLDADDLIAPTYLEEAAHLLQQNPHASLVYPATRIFGDKDGQWYAPPWDPAEFIMHNRIPCAAVFKRDVWEATGGYPENVRGLEDWALWIKAIGLGFIGVPLTRALFQYRTHPHGIFRTDGVKTHEEKYRRIVIDNWRLFPASMVEAARNGEPMTRRFE